MEPLFQMDGQAPTQARLNVERVDTAQKAVNALGVAYGTGAIAAMEAGTSVLSGHLLGGPIGALLLAVSLTVCGAVALYRKRLVAWQRLLRAVPFTIASPERISEAFFLTSDSRRYADEVIRQGRPITFAELKMAEAYALEFGKFTQLLNEPELAALAAKVGFNPYAQKSTPPRG